MTGRTLFVGCPFGARPFCSAGSLAAGTATFAFFVFLAPADFSPSESGVAFRLVELTARFCDMVGTMYGIRKGFNERRYRGRIDCVQVMTKLEMMAIQLRARRGVTGDAPRNCASARHAATDVPPSRNYSTLSCIKGRPLSLRLFRIPGLLILPSVVHLRPGLRVNCGVTSVRYDAAINVHESRTVKLLLNRLRG